MEAPHELLPAGDQPRDQTGARPVAAASERDPAGVVVLAHLRALVDTLKASDPAVRRDESESVHRMRVTTRRLRSALATFEPLLEAGTSDQLSAELRWLAGVLGEARDAEVMRDRLTTMATEDPDDRAPAGTDPEVDDVVAGDLSRELDARYRTAHDDVLHALDSPRYVRLLDSAEQLLATPPWTRTAEDPAHEALPVLVRRDWQRVQKRAAAARRAPTPTAHDTELHELRKAAKRLRYSCEALVPVFGDGAQELGSDAKALQEVLGEHQDSVVSRELLRRLVTDAGLPGGSALVLGRLQVLEQEHAERSLTRFDAAWEQVADKRHRRWLRP